MVADFYFSIPFEAIDLFSGHSAYVAVYAKPFVSWHISVCFSCRHGNNNVFCCCHITAAIDRTVDN